jgi:hypothetical protein
VKTAQPFFGIQKKRKLNSTAKSNPADHPKTANIKQINKIMPTQKQCVQRLGEIWADLGMTNILFYPTTQNIIELPLYQQKK